MFIPKIKLSCFFFHKGEKKVDIEKCKKPTSLVFDMSLGQISFSGAWGFFRKIKIILSRRNSRFQRSLLTLVLCNIQTKLRKNVFEQWSPGFTFHNSDVFFCNDFEE